jgi:Tfp pilus assembly protein PilV
MRMSRANSQSNGFIMLEVLVAMGVVSGVWMSSIQAYQGLALSLLKQEQKQILLRQEFDRYELAEQMRANDSSYSKNIKNIKSEDLKHDASRVPYRDRSLRSVAKPTFTN